ncbi:MAG: hypothetical protein ABI543_11610 [Ignavibacteria bacterium]
MKSRSIIAVCMLALLTAVTITFVSPAYSSSGDPKCAECTKTTCDESCSKVCTDTEREHCTVNMESSGNSSTSSGNSSASEVKTEGKDNSCNNCTKSSCSMMNSTTEKSNK